MNRKPYIVNEADICRKVGFNFNGIEELENIVKNLEDIQNLDESFVYSRFANPTVKAAERFFSRQLEKCNWSVLTSSGMSAIDAALSIFQVNDRRKTWLFFSETYPGTLSYAQDILHGIRGVDIKVISPYSNYIYSSQILESKIVEHKPSLIFFEVISNPLLIISDFQEIIEVTKKYDVRVVIDNTFATPLLCRPLDFGADLVVHSATKFLSGYNNLIAGIICGNDKELERKIRSYRRKVGCILSPYDAAHLLCQLNDFESRFTSQCQNAIKLARLIDSSPKVERVHFPGLIMENEKSKKLFTREIYGSVITFKLNNFCLDTSSLLLSCKNFIKGVSEYIKYSTSLGSVDSSILHIGVLFKDKHREKDYKFMLRFSVGTEDYELLEKAILKGLDLV